MRSNVYKEKIASVLQKAHLLSIGDIQKEVTNVDFSTIFRNIEQLCAEGIIRKIVISKDVVLYELIEKSHHHDHFVCNDCGTIESIHLPKRIVLAGKATAIDVLVRGVCGKCIT